MDTNNSTMMCTISSEVQGRSDWACSHVSDFGARLSRSSSISGYRGPRQPGHPIHDATHVVRAFSPRSMDVEIENFWPPPPVISKVTSRPFVACDVDVGEVPKPSSAQIDAIMAQLRGEIPTTTLLPNFLVELPEALHLHTQLRQAFKPGIKNWSNAGLAYSFGLKPLLRDLNELAHTTQRVRQRLKKLASMSDSSFQKYTFGVSVGKPHDIRVSDSGALDGPIAQGFLRGVSSDATAGIDMNIFARVIRTRRIDNNIDTFSAYADDLGFSKVGSVIWEGIPFSFVADWFYPCGRALNSLNTTAFEGCLYALGIGHQSHVTISGDVSVTGIYAAPVGAWYNTGGVNVVGGRAVIGSAYAKFYDRASGLPATQDVSHYGLRQSILSAMLCLQRA